MTEEMQFDVFVSYRREGGEILGRLLYEMLKQKYRVFFDHESLSSGRFDTKLLEIIEGARDVVVILSAGCLARCGNPGDWFMREISHALACNRNIVLLMTEDFHVPTGAELNAYPEEIATLLKYNGHLVSVAYLDSVISKLEHSLTSRPFDGARFTKPDDWRAFAEAMCDERKTAHLPYEIKHRILHNAISGFLDEYNAKIFGSMLDRMSETRGNVRTKYRYEIEIDRGFDFRLLDIAEEKYNELSESLSYSKKFLTGAPDRCFWVSFATNLDELDASLRAESFFFSENLLIEREDIAALALLDAEDKEDFYLSAMRVKININGMVLRPMQVRIDESGIFGQYAIPEELLAASETLDVKIRFRIPQRKGNTYFFASINDPTYSPYIRFTYPEEIFDVTMIPFLNRSVTSRDSKIFEGLRELSIEDEWILPVSGAIFIIEEMKP